MIYRIVVDECFEGLPNGQGRLGGLTNSYLLSGMMDRLGIRAPIGLDHHKVRFYFTEKGWRLAGRLIAVEARDRGHTRSRDPPQGAESVTSCVSRRATTRDASQSTRKTALS